MAVPAVDLQSKVNASLRSDGIEIRGPVTEEFAQILTPAALQFLGKMSRKFEARRQELLARRVERQKDLDAGHFPDFLPETAEIRAAEWTVAPIPADLQDRRVEITGPVDRKMIINALNCGANVFMADFEDANSPTWTNNLGVHRVFDAGRLRQYRLRIGTIPYVLPYVGG